MACWWRAKDVMTAIPTTAMVAVRIALWNPTGTADRRQSGVCVHSYLVRAWQTLAVRAVWRRQHQQWRRVFSIDFRNGNSASSAKQCPHFSRCSGSRWCLYHARGFMYTNNSVTISNNRLVSSPKWLWKVNFFWRHTTGHVPDKSMTRCPCTR